MMTKNAFSLYLEQAVLMLRMRHHTAISEDTAQALLLICHTRAPGSIKPTPPNAVATLKKDCEEQERQAAVDPLLQRLPGTEGYQHVYAWLASQEIEFDLEMHGAAVFVRFQDDADAALFRLRWG